MSLAHLFRELEEECLPRSGAFGFRRGRGRGDGIPHHLRVFVGAAADFEEVDARVDEEGDLRHCFFKGGGAVVCGVELDADGEGGWNRLAGLLEDGEDEACAFFGCAAIFVGAEVCLELLILVMWVCVV